MSYKIVNLKKPVVVSAHETKQDAAHALAIMKIKHAKKRDRSAFDFGIVRAGAIFRNYKCMGWIWA